MVSPTGAVPAGTSGAVFRKGVSEMRTIVLSAAAVLAVGWSPSGWADEGKKEDPKATKIVAEGMT
jgi:hypothetical protein